MIRILIAIAGILMSAVASIAHADQTGISSYAAARPIFWKQLYPGGGSDIYCADKFQISSSTNGTPPGMQIEHAYPADWMGEHLQCGSRKECGAGKGAANLRFDRMEADLHNMFPALGTANNMRSNRRFGESRTKDRPIAQCDLQIDPPKNPTGIAEPRAIVKGNLARAIFYMHQEYGLPVDKEMGQTLLKWHEVDPPTQDEIRRNERIFQIQNTRNPFIDDPDRAKALKFD